MDDSGTKRRCSQSGHGQRPKSRQKATISGVICSRREPGDCVRAARLAVSASQPEDSQGQPEIASDVSQQVVHESYYSVPMPQGRGFLFKSNDLAAQLPSPFNAEGRR